MDPHFAELPMARSRSGPWEYTGPDVSFVEWAHYGQLYLMEHQCDTLTELRDQHRTESEVNQAKLTGDPDGQDEYHQGEIYLLDLWVDVIDQLFDQPPSVTGTLWALLVAGRSPGEALSAAIAVEAE